MAWITIPHYCYHTTTVNTMILAHLSSNEVVQNLNLKDHYVRRHRGMYIYYSENLRYASLQYGLGWRPISQNNQLPFIYM